MRDTDTTADSTEQGDEREGLTRRSALGLLGGAGLGTLVLGTASAQGNGTQPWYEWTDDVTASGHSLSNLGAVSMAADSTPITEFTGINLAVEEGTLNAEELPESVHIANDYPGETLDEKLSTLIDELPSADPALPRNQPGTGSSFPRPIPRIRQRSPSTVKTFRSGAGNPQ